MLLSLITNMIIQLLFHCPFIEAHTGSFYDVFPVDQHTICNYTSKGFYSFILGIRVPGLNLRLGGAVWHPRCWSATTIFRVVHHPFVMNWGIHRGWKVSFVVEPTIPLWWNLGAIVVQVVFFIVENDPTISTHKVAIVFVILIAVLILSDQCSVLQCVSPVDLVQRA